MSKTYKNPYFHMQFFNFLKEKQLTKLGQIYKKLQFKQKTSDLFHFFQTNQLADEKSLDFFKKRLTEQFTPLCTPEQVKKSFYTTFASYYFEGDYLLCHDDIIEDRKYAFSFYLQDFEHGGELVLINDKANKQCKRIKPKKNTLVIFEVCDQSYHEVAYCTGNGRKAITGWFNVKGQGSKRVQKTIDKFVPHLLKDTIPFALESTYTDEEYFQLMDVQYQFNIVKQTLEGPFYSRRVHRIEIKPAVIFQLSGYELLSSDFYKFKEGDYLLLNDPMNNLGSDGIIDVFITNLPEGFEVDQKNMLVKIIEEDGSLSGIPQIHDSLFIVHRDNKQYYIERNGKEFILAHLIYKKNVKAVKKQKIANKKVDTKQTENKLGKKTDKKQVQYKVKTAQKIKKIVKPTKKPVKPTKKTVKPVKKSIQKVKVTSKKVFIPQKSKKINKKSTNHYKK